MSYADWPAGPRCICGYVADDSNDLDEHILAMARGGDPFPHNPE